MKRQLEICPWCKNKIKVAPGRRQPCPSCEQLINVSPEGNSAVQYREFILSRIEQELLDFQGALAENLPVNLEIFKRTQNQARKLQEDL